jgi:hypothetical protein
MESADGPTNGDPVLVETCDEELHGKLVEEINLQNGYDQLLIKSNVVEIESKSFYAKLHDLNIVIDSLKHENFVPVDKAKCFEDDLVIVTVLPNPANVKLDQILSFQKPYGDVWNWFRQKCFCFENHNCQQREKKKLKIKNLSLIVLRMFFLKLLIRARILRWTTGPRLRV